MASAPTEPDADAGPAGDGSFSALIRRVRAGDDAAAAELVGRYGPAIRRAVRVRLRDPRLQRLFDSVDICQSVFASFFVRAALGQYELETPDQLLRLLAKIARNKLASQARREGAGRRDRGRVAAGAAVEDCPAKEESPSRQVAAKELLDEARSRLSVEEREILEQRALGVSWAEIAAGRGGRPDALRVRFARAVARVTRELGLDEVDDG